MSKIYVGDIGTLISLDSGVSLVGATTIEIRYKKPGTPGVPGAVGAWTATASGTSGVYTTVEGDLDQPGVWKLQLYVELPDWSGLGETVEMFVSKVFE